ncbi:RimJ/RimL family protein N-acetyltransferase [Kitasatospora sp. MAA19]|uniref:GNAT family N-acetyltransferase n=1 Tax=Kitasatospora sp. MAA19 TaxID=3035090 RepID=UPI002475006F|nr:GNAT family N-acetyltransferase [Kitasatospora sp. MAA19]MDH6707578.1 RimJ/RimL family protein N-acetyltransferase [Kitasatospora sp. MAA19]
MAKTVTYLEMTAPEDLRPAPPVPALALLRADATSPAVQAVQAEVGRPHGWKSSSRTEQDWAAHRAQHPLRQSWLLTHDGEPAGIVALEPHPGGDVEITTFGLLPAMVGRGLGGYALTLALRQAWATEPIGAGTALRVWLCTNTNDHPNALPNYHKRGLRTFRTEVHPG